MLGNEEDFTAALGFEVARPDAGLSQLNPDKFAHMLSEVCRTYPHISLFGTTLRTGQCHPQRPWAVCFADGWTHAATTRADLEILDRIGGGDGDAFVSGLIFGLLDGLEVQTATEYRAAHGALAMTTRVDTSMATVDEVVALVGGSARVRR